MTLDLKNIVVYSSDYKVLDNISITIPPHQFTVIMGPSGCGKSTLLKVVAGILIPDEGELEIDGHNYHMLPEQRLLEVKKKNGFVFQDSALWSNKTIFENLSLPLRFHFHELSSQEIMGKVTAALEEINLMDSINLRPAQLSIGEQKLVSFMRAYILQPSLFFLDEPTTSIDLSMRKKILSFLQREKTKRTTIVAVTHDSEIISYLTDYLVVLKQGVVVQTGPINEVKMSSHEVVKEVLAEFLGAPAQPASPGSAGN